MYRNRYWTMRQYAGFGSARDSNRRYRYLLEQGQTGLSVAFDLPTQMGYDSDDPEARGEVGKVGVAIASIEDMRVLTDALPLDRVSISMTINSTAAILMALLLAVARERGIDWKDLSGTVQNDLLKEYIARGTYIFPPAASLKLTTDILEFCGAEVPRWNTISISGYHIREAGSTAVQEVAFTLSNAIAYVEAAQRRGLAGGGQVGLVDSLHRGAHMRDRTGGERRLHQLDDQRLGDLGPLDQHQVTLAQVQRVVREHPRQPLDACVGHRNRPSR
jgi:methylmalonyl-CoA mutase N-terminal domain/subunit